MKNLLYVFLITILLPAFLTTCEDDSGSNTPPPYSYNIPEETNDGWQTASLHDNGVQIGPLTKLVDYINFGIYTQVHSLLIVKNGYLVFEEYWQGNLFNYGGENHKGAIVDFNKDNIHNQASVTKSVASTLIGIAINNGSLSLNDKVYDFFPEYADQTDDAKNGMTIEHLLSMTAGYDWNEGEFAYGDSRNDLIHMWNVDDPLKYLMEKPLISEPGEEFYYNSGCTNILGEILFKVSGLKADNFAREYLFGPLGINNYSWQKFNNGVVFVSGDLRIRPRDMAKLGCLFLNDGKWNNEQIVSAEWVEQSTSKYISLNQNISYGYQWWIQEYQIGGQTYKSFSARGWGGQRIEVITDLDLVIVLTGGNYTTNEPVDEIIQNYILTAMF